MKVIAALITVLIIVPLTWFLWLSRPPTTQLVDASGKKLAAGTSSDGQQDALDDSMFREAEALIESRDFATAKAKLLEILLESDRDGEACILLSDVSRELEEVEGAVDYGLKAVTLLPESAPAHLSYAKALGMQIFSDMQSVTGMIGAMARVSLFKEEIELVIALDPHDTEARSMLVFYHMAPKPIGDIDKAIELCHEIERLDPVSGRQLLAMCYQRKEEPERAVSILLAGIEEYPEERSFHASLADIYSEQQRFDEADVEYEKARTGEKDESYYRSLYGQARMRIQNEYEPERAIELLNEFIADEPDIDRIQSVAHACWRKGNALEQLGRKQEARDAYEESLRREPGLKLAKEALEKLTD